MSSRTIGMLIVGCGAAVGFASPALGQAVLHPSASQTYADSLHQSVFQAAGLQQGDPRFVEGTRFEPRFPGPSAGPGFPVMLTWSYAPDGLLLPAPPAANNPNPEPSSFMATLDGELGRLEWLLAVSRSFDRWQAVSGIAFVFVSEAGAGLPLPPPGTDPNDFEPQDNGDPWPEPMLDPQPDDGPEGYYDPSGMINDTDGNPSPPNVLVGDIRIAGRSWDGPTEPDGSAGAGMIFVNDPPDFNADPIGAPDDGNIMVDTDEVWGDALAPNVFEIAMTRAIGFAIGLHAYCPKSQPSVLEFQSGVNPVGPPTNPVQEPFPQLEFISPQYVDVLAVQKLYGDPTGNNDAYTAAIQHDFGFVFDPVDGSITFAPFSNDGTPIGVGEKTTAMGMIVPDIDRFVFEVPPITPQATFTATMTPAGQTYESAANDGVECSPDVTVVDGLIEDNISLTLETFNPVTNQFVFITSVNAGGPGETEVLQVELPPGRYYLTVAGDPSIIPSDDFTNIQLYDLDMTLVVEEDLEGTPLGPILDGNLDVGGLFTGIGRPVFTDAAVQEQVIEDFSVPALNNGGPFIGDSSEIVFMDATLPFVDHNAFAGRRPLTLFWEGTNPSIDLVGTHATATVSTAGGIQLPEKNFLGASEPTQLASVNVARPGSLINGQFPVSLEAVYFALFGLTDPVMSTQLGLATPADIFVAPWNAPGADTLGVGPTALAHDAAVTMRDVLVVTSGGNAGNANNIDNPNDCGPGFQGDLFVGARTIGTPATAYNVLVVGATGASVLDPSVQNPEYKLVPRVQSKGPLNSLNPAAVGENVVVPGVRPGLHLVAPGWSFVQEIPPLPEDATPPQVCAYPGNQPVGLINLPVLDENSDPDAFSGVGGSSVATAIVAGSAALLRDAAVDEGMPTDQLILRAVLMNSAVKQPGWSNNPAVSAPFPPQDKITALFNLGQPAIVGFSDQVFDYAQGAGVLNLEQAFLQYFMGARDLAETSPSVPTVTKTDIVSGGIPPDSMSALPGGDDSPTAIAQARAHLEAARLSPEPEMFQIAQFVGGPIGTPSGSPGVGGGVSSNFPSRPPSVPPDMGNQPGPGDPGFDPVGERAIRLFFEENGLSLPDFPNSPIIPFENDPEQDPQAQTTDEEDGSTRLYIWAQMLGTAEEQTWDQISFNIGSVGDVTITDFQIFNTQAFFQNPVPQVRERWTVVEGGQLVDPGRIEGISLSADTDDPQEQAFGVTTDLDVTQADQHFDDETGSTLLGFIEVQGEGELFFEVGEGFISNTDEDEEDAKILFGFGDEFDPAISGDSVGTASSLRDALVTMSAVLTVPIPVKVTGWDHAMLGVRSVTSPIDPDDVNDVGYIDYFIEEPLQGEAVVATLVWDRTTIVREPDLTNLADPNVPVTPIQLELENLNLQVIACDEFGNVLVDGEGEPVVLGASTGTFETIEHVVVAPPFATHVLLRVAWAGQAYAIDLSDEEDGLAELRVGEVEFALAWGVWGGVPLNLPSNMVIPEDNQSLPAMPAQSAAMEMQSFLNSFGTVKGQPGYRPASDLNNDGRVDSSDLNAILNNLRR